MCNTSLNPYGMRRLSPIFRPGQFDVICARGKMAYDHEGNRWFRALVKQNQKQYSAATSKYEKSKIVSFIVSSVRRASQEGGFIKNIDGSWFEVGDRHAKEKVGQTFRDLLHTKYSSSTKAKARARMQKRPTEEEIEKEEEEDELGTSPPKCQPVPNRNPSSFSGDDKQSSLSVVSQGSNGTCNDAPFVLKSNSGVPPLKSVVFVTKEQKRPPPAFFSTSLPVTPISPSNSWEHSKSSWWTGFGTGVDPFAIPSIPDTTRLDLEPLPLGISGVNANVSPHDEASSSSSFSEPGVQSFDDAMTEFCLNMGVAV